MPVHVHLLLIPVPISVDPPSVVGVSPIGLQISWSTPSPEEAQGIILIYRLYQNLKTDLSADPFGPRYTWKVSLAQVFS